ncbi:MAG: hypothetical protein KJ904_06880 [Alphaproteobacteria bacterium]|nr:hypothetical protein [Alphaproteobacteria bacterium]MBU0797360.1 hypothetical protein [Alphaproteobacteria bacterium]MBU0886872.1 hypothetical protein [Alphaproteobacteria bacterium]MBU1812385.1 hypothetical protein [Alphaproteobacteria bacterium]MBU2089851.1 hypothetical protein [Alphaproteobacteria bacterium]
MKYLSNFSIKHILARLFACIVIILATYNPLGYSVYHWFSVDFFADFKIKIFLSIAGAISYYFIFRVIYSNHGILGIATLLLMTALSIFELYHQSFQLNASNTAFILLAEIVFAVYLGIALSTPHIVTRLSGQAQKRILTG